LEDRAHSKEILFRTDIEWSGACLNRMLITSFKFFSALIFIKTSPRFKTSLRLIIPPLQPMEDFGRDQEVWNVRTHALGVVAGLVGIPVLLAMASLQPEGIVVDEFTALCIYGLGFLMVFTFSALYHFFETPKRKYALEIWDHFGIYFMIAGTYTPFVVCYAEPGDKALLLATVWGLAILGSIFKGFFPAKFRMLSMFLYVAMGLVMVFAPQSFKAAIPQIQMWWIIAGAVVYIVGLIFYVWALFRHHHAIWHLFVVGGALCHYYGILLIYLPE